MRRCTSIIRYCVLTGILLCVCYYSIGALAYIFRHASYGEKKAQPGHASLQAQMQNNSSAQANSTAIFLGNTVNSSTGHEHSQKENGTAAKATLPSLVSAFSHSEHESKSLDNKQQKNYLQVDEVYATIIQWEIAWKEANLEAYISWYSPDAIQGHLQGKEAIRAAKKRLWATAPPGNIVFVDMDISVDGDTATVEAQQVYTYTNGQTDRGLKRMHMRKTDGRWLIVKELWAAL